MFDHKLQKIKKYLIKHLNKEFIFFSFTLYISLILFAEKKDESLRFCVDYRKLNALVKRLNVTTFVITVTKIDQLLKTARNKLEDVNLQELSYEEILKEVKAKLSLKYHDYLNMFD